MKTGTAVALYRYEDALDDERHMNAGMRRFNV